MPKARLLFVSPRFLFPIDSGGKIRTTGILREMLGGEFEITLASPAPPVPGSFEKEMATVADHWHFWPNPSTAFRRLRRVAQIGSSLPIPVASDLSRPGRALIEKLLADRYDVVVFDFAHAAVLAPDNLSVPSVLFTHNVEAEIFKRHADVCRNPIMRAVWRDQWRKMVRFEHDSVQRFDRVVAVSERDRDMLVDAYDARNVDTIPTGVDLNYFEYRPEPNSGSVVFTGSMDWLANQDGIEFFMDKIWSQVADRVDGAMMQVVGRSPPQRLVSRAAKFGESWKFTGFVDDVRPYIRQASAYVIPLRVGGGTRLKVFEAIATGCPVVSTPLGVEGLGLQNGVHFLSADTPEEFAAATARVLSDAQLARELSRAARDYVEENASNAVVARRFEAICRAAMDSHQAR